MNLKNNTLWNGGSSTLHWCVDSFGRKSFEKKRRQAFVHANIGPAAAAHYSIRTLVVRIVLVLRSCFRMLGATG